MSANSIHYDQLSGVLQRAGIVSDAAEIHGLLCGMLSGGMAMEQQDWLQPLADFTNQGEEYNDEATSMVMALYAQTCEQLMGAEFDLVLCMPDDDAPINERGQSLIDWVQGFMSGFGLYQNDLSRCSEEVTEALEDFADIARMDESMPESEESEQALLEVSEYVRISAMLCFNELGAALADDKNVPRTLH